MHKEDVLEVVDDNDNVIGLESRKVVHEKGLLHREVHVLFYTPKGEIIFQHRAKDKDTYPDLLDATVGGHVEVGDSYIDTAIKETKEETGLTIKPEDLHFLVKLKMKHVDPVTGKTNNAFKYEFAYKFTGKISDLQVEEGKAVGFESCPIDSLFNMNESDKKKFLPAIFLPEFLNMFKMIKDLI